MVFLEMLKAAFLGIVQGITEWLPISSTGHMILVDAFLKMNITEEFKNLFLVVIQFGSILAVVVLYFHKLNPFSPKKRPKERRETLSLWGKVIIGCIPVGIIGMLFEEQIDQYLYNPITVAITLIVYGVLFILLENRRRRPRINSFGEMTYKDALLIGAFQTLSLIPGTSRSGSTILGGVFLGASREIAAEYSFFLAIPVMLGASAYKILKYFIKYGMFGGVEWGILLVGMVVAFLVSLVAIKFLMNFIKKHDFKPFGYYRIILGIIVLIFWIFVMR